MSDSHLNSGGNVGIQHVSISRPIVGLTVSFRRLKLNPEYGIRDALLPWIFFAVRLYLAWDLTFIEQTISFAQLQAIATSMSNGFISRLAVPRSPKAAHDPSRLLKAFKISLLTLFIGCLIGGLVLYQLAFHQVQLPEIKIDPSAAESLANKLRDAQNATGLSSPRTVDVSEVELNSLVARYLPSTSLITDDDGNASLRDLKLKLIEDRFRAYLLVNYKGKNIGIVVEGRV